MSLLCGKSPALESINTAVSGIKSQIALGKSALTALKSQGTALKSKITAFIPVLPSLDSFQEEFAALASSQNLLALPAFKLKWAGKIPNLDQLTAKITGNIADLANLDFCKDVPNTKVNPVTAEVIKDPPVAVQPVKEPEKIVPAPPITVKAPEKPSTGNTQTWSQKKDTNDYANTYLPQFKLKVNQPIQDSINSLNSEKTALTNSATYKSIQSKQRSNNKSPEQLRNAGLLTTDEVSLLSQLDIKDKAISNAAWSLAKLIEYSNKKELNSAGYLASKTLAEYLNTFKGLPKFSDYVSYIEVINGLIEANKLSVNNHASYIHNKELASW